MLKIFRNLDEEPAIFVMIMYILKYILLYSKRRHYAITNMLKSGKI